MHSSLLVLLALLGGAHAFASTPKEVAGTTGKGVPSRMTYSVCEADSCVCEADSCKYAGDGDCDDGGKGSAWSVCELGSDWSDCADRGTKGCMVPQCAVGEYHEANAQGGFDCASLIDALLTHCVKPCAVGEYRKSEGAECTAVVETSESVAPCRESSDLKVAENTGVKVGTETSVCDQMTIWDSKIKRCVPCVYNPTHWTHKRCDRCADWNPHRNTYYQCDR